MSKYKLINDQFKDKWINKPNNMGDVGDLQDITDELNNLLHERDEAREDLEFLLTSRNAIIAKGLELKKQLDEAREDLEFLLTSRNAIIAKGLELKKQLDEAREQANYWKSQYELEKGLYVIELK